jgi:selenide,water dikinase
MDHPDLIEGHARFSDAGVFRVRPDLALVQTVDFFPPIVDDPRDFGRIAAANSLSDCYAMGGKPATALVIAGFPAKALPTSVLGEIFAGGAEKVLEAGAVIVGGHTVEDTEIKYGLCVTGTIHPADVVSNAGARPGETLVLTKPLGMGTVSTAIKRQRIGDAEVREAVRIMSALNRDASEAMKELGARGATDITGFGLLGHAYQMAESSGVTLRIDPDRVPIFPGALELAGRGFLSGGARRNREYAAGFVSLSRGLSPILADLLFDSETSGGLLISLRPEAAAELVQRLRSKGHAQASIVGEVRPRGKCHIEVGTEERKPAAGSHVTIT